MEFISPLVSEHQALCLPVISLFSGFCSIRDVTFTPLEENLEGVWKSLLTINFWAIEKAFVYIPMFITVLLTIARIWTKPKCPRTDADE